jgi:hypothetical protein
LKLSVKKDWLSVVLIAFGVFVVTTFVVVLVMANNIVGSNINAVDAIERADKATQHSRTLPLDAYEFEALGRKRLFEGIRLREEMWVWEVRIHAPWETEDHYPWLMYVCCNCGMAIEARYSSLFLQHNCVFTREL